MPLSDESACERSFGNGLMKFEAVIFDLDGTLLDSLEDIASAANSVLSDLGKSTYPILDYRELVGDGLAMLFQRALPECESDLVLRASCMNRFEEAYSTCWNNRSKPYNGIDDLLKKLEENSISLSVLSNKSDAFTNRCMKHFFGKVQFKHILGQTDRFPRKPDPSSAKWLASQLAVDIDRIAYVGDTNTDMKTALGSGLYAIGVTWGFRTERELRAAGAMQICDDVGQLADVLLGS